LGLPHARVGFELCILGEKPYDLGSAFSSPVASSKIGLEEAQYNGASLPLRVSFGFNVAKLYEHNCPF
jgi:hypothetical protein